MCWFFIFCIVVSFPPYSFADSDSKNIVFHRVSSSISSFYSNSYIIEGANSVVLVDSHMDELDADNLRKQADDIGKLVEAIVITHAHPDHFMGLEFLYSYYTNATILASPGTAQVIIEAAKSWPDFTNEILELGNESVVLAGGEFHAVVLPDAESVQPLILYEKRSRTLISGDLVLNGQHLWLAEGRLNEWRENLDQLNSMFEIDTLLPGHGEIGTTDLIDKTLRYLNFFMGLDKAAHDHASALKEMHKEFPKHAFPTALEFSVRAFGFNP